jgi:preprotein translocase subunit SecD
VKALAAALMLLPGAATADDVLRLVLGETVIAVSPPHVVARPDSSPGGPVLRLQLAPEPAAKLSQLTAANIGKTLSIELCGYEVMKPVIRERIRGGVVAIAAEYSAAQLRTLAERITHGDCDGVRPIVKP